MSEFNFIINGINYSDLGFIWNKSDIKCIIPLHVDVVEMEEIDDMWITCCF